MRPHPRLSVASSAEQSRKAPCPVRTRVRPRSRTVANTLACHAASSGDANAFGPFLDPDFKQPSRVDGQRHEQRAFLGKRCSNPAQTPVTKPPSTVTRIAGMLAEKCGRATTAV